MAQCFIQQKIWASFTRGCISAPGQEQFDLLEFVALQIVVMNCVLLRGWC
jgi:hypothetical protein